LALRRPNNRLSAAARAATDCRHSLPLPMLPVTPSAAKLGARVGGVHERPGESASASIDEKIKQLGDWRGKTLAKVREIVHEADPEIVEEWKWVKPTNPGTPVWSHGGIVCTGAASREIGGGRAPTNTPPGPLRSKSDTVDREGAVRPTCLFYKAESLCAGLLLETVPRPDRRFEAGIE
jgi:hypothetical protein